MTVTTNNTHTPGPWILGTYDHAVHNITGPKGEMPFIATIPSGRDNREANARLIAAAPDLLAALQAMMTIAEITTAANQDGLINCDILAKARAAIAKAVNK